MGREPCLEMEGSRESNRWRGGVEMCGQGGKTWTWVAPPGSGGEGIGEMKRWKWVKLRD